MVRGIGATYAALVRTAWTYLSSGALFRLMRLRKGPVIAALFPVMVLLTQFAVALALGGLAAVAVNGGLGLALSWGAGAGVGTFAGVWLGPGRKPWRRCVRRPGHASLVAAEGSRSSPGT
jgi:hypothetical protein